MNNPALILILAGSLAGLVNFFISYVKLPQPAAAFTESGDPELKNIWWFALLGYIIIGISGAFLVPLINSVVSLKGLPAELSLLTDKTTFPGYTLFGYGLISGYSANKLLVNLTQMLDGKIKILEERVDETQRLIESERKAMKNPSGEKEYHECLPIKIQATS